MAIARIEPVRLYQKKNGALGDRKDIMGRHRTLSRSWIGWWFIRRRYANAAGARLKGSEASE